MLTIYRRHLKKCDHRAEGRQYRRCQCPIWVDGLLRKEDIRQSLDLRDWTKAQELIRDWEASGTREEKTETPDDDKPITIVSAAAKFLRDARARKLKRVTLKKYCLLFRRLRKFAHGRGLRFLCELKLDHLRDFRASWPNSSLSAMKNLERLRGFLCFAEDANWIEQNPARKLKNPKVTQSPTLPFSSEEMLAILAAATRKISKCRPEATNRARRTRALALFLRYTGLRISDGVGCAVERLQNGKLFLYTQKTGQHVYCPLPDFVVQELEAIPRVSPGYWFWTGVGSLETARKKWSEALTELFTEAQVKDGHAHRFRDTFSVELLKAGTPIERVSILLGHASVRVTEKHYNAWNRARQEQAEADVARSWSSDPVVQFETKGTRRVHGDERAN